jgi:hypothetical membrane protein
MGRKKVNRLLIACGIIAPIYFGIIWLVLGLFFPGYNHFRDYISEFGATGSPIQAAGNYLGFLPMGILMSLFAAGLYRVVGVDWSGKIGSGLLLISGLFMSSTAFFPCDIACDNYTRMGNWHEFFSDYTLYAAGLALLVFACHAWKGITLPRYWTFIFMGFVMITGVFMFFYHHSDVDSLYGGLLQRLTSLIALSSMAISSIYLLKVKIDRL